MATYSVTTNAKQDAAIAACAAKYGKTAQNYVEDELKRVLQRAVNECDRDDAAAVAAAYLAATNAKQSTVKTALGL